MFARRPMDSEIFVGFQLEVWKDEKFVGFTKGGGE